MLKYHCDQQPRQIERFELLLNTFHNNQLRVTTSKKGTLLCPRNVNYLLDSYICILLIYPPREDL